MTNEELLSILIEFPLDAEVESCHPVIEQSIIKFRAGCDQSHCHLNTKHEEDLKRYESREKRIQTFIHISKDLLAAMGKDKETPEQIRFKLRALYGYLNDLEKH